MSLLILLSVVSLILFDARHHFDADLVTLKIKHQSAQRNWNLFYSQQQVFSAGSFRYERDFSEIAERITPGTSLLSDLATSYYAATYLPVFVMNIHRHQQGMARPQWHRLLHDRTACYLDVEANLWEFEKFLKLQEQAQAKNPHLQLRYVLLNKDHKNRNLGNDCFSLRHRHLQAPLSEIADLVYEGDFMNLYKVR
ncbi:MAG: hypothetical protein KJP04_04160 [Arenicella sp.]|nr:hypothetical protein [Arenicella sp.]